MDKLTDHRLGVWSAVSGTGGLKHTPRDALSSVPLMVTFPPLEAKRSKNVLVLKKEAPESTAREPPSVGPELGVNLCGCGGG